MKTEHDEQPIYCEQGCGEEAAVVLKHATLCSDCATLEFREVLAEVLPFRICGRLLHEDGIGLHSICLKPYGLSHTHG